MKIQFEKASNTSDDSNADIGILNIPNAYGIAYIIDGQHRLYGYAGTEKYKFTNTIPVVAFHNMESRQQLQIFMDINENQKAVSKDLRIDLEEDINWESKQVDSRLKALRSSIIKVLANDNSSVLANKISVGEDTSNLASSPFESGLRHSSLLPTATKTSYTKDVDVCMYNTKNLDHNKAMIECKKKVSAFIQKCYNYAYQELDEMIFNDFILCNRGTYAFIALIGSINKHLVETQKITQFEPLETRMNAISPYLDILFDYLHNLPAEDDSELRIIRGQQAEKTWLCRFQNSVHKKNPEFNPDGLETWIKTQDSGLQERGREFASEIFPIIKESVLQKLQDLYDESWEDSVKDIKKNCLSRYIQNFGDDENFDLQTVEWTDALEMSDLKSIIEKNWTLRNPIDPNYQPFCKEFAIQVNDSFSTKNEKLAWISDYMKIQKTIADPKGKKLTPQQVSKLEFIYNSLKAEL